MRVRENLGVAGVTLPIGRSLVIRASNTSSVGVVVLAMAFTSIVLCPSAAATRSEPRSIPR